MPCSISRIGILISKAECIRLSNLWDILVFNTYKDLRANCCKFSRSQNSASPLNLNKRKGGGGSARSEVIAANFLNIQILWHVTL